MIAIAAAKISGPHIDFAGLSPIIALAGGAMVVLLLASWGPPSRAGRSCRR